MWHVHTMERYLQMKEPPNGTRTIVDKSQKQEKVDQRVTHYSTHLKFLEAAYLVGDTAGQGGLRLSVGAGLNKRAIEKHCGMLYRLDQQQTSPTFLGEGDFLKTGKAGILCDKFF